jgi:hypothetical protein
MSVYDPNINIYVTQELPEFRAANPVAGDRSTFGICSIRRRRSKMERFSCWRLGIVGRFEVVWLSRW